MSVAAQQNADGSWSPAIPEPFWVRRWFRWKPACWTCSVKDGLGRGITVKFRNRAEWEKHWMAEHGAPS